MTKICAHCQRRRLAKFIEWHPGIREWQCKNLGQCDAAIATRIKRGHPMTARRCGKCDAHRKPKSLTWSRVHSNWCCVEPSCYASGWGTTFNGSRNLQNKSGRHRYSKY